MKKIEHQPDDESERLAELKDLGTIVAVAQTATLMAKALKRVCRLTSCSRI
jgi:hypothetical protein